MSATDRNTKLKRNIIDENPKSKKISIKKNYSQNRPTLYEKPEYTKQIGNYVLFDEIGTGTFSKVSKAIHIITEKTVAVKILNKKKISDNKDLERIYREMDILKKIFHPNICQLYESYVTVHNYYLVLEYIDGGDLFDYITKNKYLSEEKSCKFYRQLISVIEYLNNMNITHRDIKPENILLDSTHQNIKLIDFGLSNYYNDEELLKSSCGSPCYASPEMLSGSPYQGIATDIWSSGIVLYSMLMGTLPFTGQELLSLYRQIKSGKFYLPSTLSLEAMDLLKKLLQVNPKNRISLNEIKEHKWFKFDNSPIYKGIFLKNNEKIWVNQDVFNYMINNYFENEIKKEEIYKMIEENKCNKYTATYHIIKKYIMKIDDKDKLFQKIDDDKLINMMNDISIKKNVKTRNSSKNNILHINLDSRNRSGNNTKIKSRNSINSEYKIPFNTDYYLNNEELTGINNSYNKNENNLTANLLNNENSTIRQKLFSKIKEKIVNLNPKNNTNKIEGLYHKKEYINMNNCFCNNKNKNQDTYSNDLGKSEEINNNNVINIEFKKKPIECIILKRNKINESQNQNNNTNSYSINYNNVNTEYNPKFDNYSYNYQNDNNSYNININKNIKNCDKKMNITKNDYNKKNLNIEIENNNNNSTLNKNYYTHNTSPSNLIKTENNNNYPIQKNSTLMESSSISNKKVNNMNFYVINNFINNKKNRCHYQTESESNIDDKKIIISNNIDSRNKFCVKSNNFDYSKTKTEDSEVPHQHKVYNKIKVNLKNDKQGIDYTKSPEIIIHSKDIDKTLKITSASKKNQKILDYNFANNFMNNTATSIFYSKKNNNNNNSNKKQTKLNGYTSLTNNNSLINFYNKKFNSTVTGDNFYHMNKNDATSKEIRIEENSPLMENMSEKNKRIFDVYNKKIIIYGANNNSKQKPNNKTLTIDKKNEEREHSDNQYLFEKRRMKFTKKNYSELKEKLNTKGIRRQNTTNNFNRKAFNTNYKEINVCKKGYKTLRNNVKNK